MGDLPLTERELILAVSVPVVYLALVLLGRSLKRRRGVRLGWPYHLFAVSLAIFIPGYEFFRWPFIKELGAVTTILGAIFIIALVDRFVWQLYFQQKHRVKVPKFFSELLTILILLGALFLVLRLGYGLNPTGLLLAPGIAAVVIGLAMQDLMSNIVAGLAIQFGKAFKEGDWLVIDHKHAQVVEINWRSTRLLTTDSISLDIPNRDIARQMIVNLNLPVRQHAMRIPVSIDYTVPPSRVKDVLLHAAANAKGVLAEPKPRVYLKSFGTSAVEYEIKFWLEDHSLYTDICDAIHTNVWYGLHRHGIRIPFPTQTIQLQRPARDKQQEIQSAARIILRQQPLFKCLTDAQLDSLLPRGRLIHFGRGEKLIEQGQNGDSMFILVDGEANVVVERNGAGTQVASLGSGDCFGEMSLLTGERRSASVIAHSDCEVVEIGKPVIANSLKENPELLNKLSELLARRQMETDGVMAANAQPSVAGAKQSQYQATFLDKLRGFFEL